MALESAEIVCMEIADSVEIKLDYSYYGTVSSTVCEYEGIIRATQYVDNVIIRADIKSEFTDKLIDKLTDRCNGKIMIEKISRGYCEF